MKSLIAAVVVLASFTVDTRGQTPGPKRCGQDHDRPAG
jgi:hypothetical protein